MANVTLNAVMTAGNNGDTNAGDDVSTSITAAAAITVAAGSNRAAYVLIGSDSALVACACTWNGTSMVSLGSADTAPGTPHAYSQIFALANDAQVSADTTPDIVVSWSSGTTDIYIGAIVLNNVQQSANGVDPAHTVLDNTGDLTIDVTGTSDGATMVTQIRNGSDPTTLPISGGDYVWNFDGFGPGGAGAYRLNLTGTNAYDFNSGTTGTVRASVGIHVLSDGVAGGDVATDAVGASATAQVGALVIDVRPAPPYTLTRVTG
jgi:hypothetical protein